MTNKIKGFTDTRNIDSVNNTAYFDVKKIEADELRYTCVSPLNHYFFDGKPIEYIYLTKDNGNSSEALPHNIKDLEGNEVDIKAENVAYKDFYDYKEHVIIADKYTVVM